MTDKMPIHGLISCWLYQGKQLATLPLSRRRRRRRREREKEVYWSISHSLSVCVSSPQWEVDSSGGILLQPPPPPPSTASTHQSLCSQEGERQQKKHLFLYKNY